MTQFKGFAGVSETQLRQLFSYLFAQDSVGLTTDGVLTGLGVLQTTTASASVVVGRGAGVVQDTVVNGVVPLVNDTDLTLDVLTANPVGGLPRNDMVIFDAGTGTIRLLTGVPNASPTDPTVPATAIPLARLRHAASATTVPTSKIDNVRVFTRLFGLPLNIPKAVATGSVTIAPAGPNVPTNTTVSFPAGRFTATPVVTVSIGTGITGTVSCFVWSDNETATNFRAWLNRSSTTATIINWTAVEM